MMARKQSVKGTRVGARRRALQALYQWQLTGQSPLDIERQYLADQDNAAFQGEYFSKLLHGVIDHCQAIDQALQEFADRPVAEVDPIERAILRLGAFELLYQWDVPCRVILNEAINLAKSFGATQQSYKYVNGVLDKLAHKVRPVEAKTPRRKRSA